MDQQKENSNSDVLNFFIDNSQNRDDDALLLNVPDPNIVNIENSNSDVLNFFIDNSQNRDEDALLLNVPYPNIVNIQNSSGAENISESVNQNNDYNSDDDDTDMNQGYENYLSTLTSNIVNDHNYSNRVSQSDNKDVK